MEAVTPAPTVLSCYGSIAMQPQDSKHSEISHKNKLPNGTVFPTCLEDTRVERRRIFKNLGVLSISMLLVFSAHNCILNLQSTINQGNGSRSLAMAYLARAISSYGVTSWLLKKITIKCAFMLRIMGFGCYVAANFHPRSYTLLPTAFLLGVTSAPFWVAIGSYIKKLGYRYALLTGKNNEVVQSQMFGLFFAAFQFSFFLDGVVAATVFMRYATLNGTSSSDTLSEMCGISYCPGNELSGNQTTSLVSSIIIDVGPSWEQIVIVFSVVLLLHVIGGVGVMFFLEPIDRFKTAGQVEECSTTLSLNDKCNFPRLLPVTPALVFLAPLPVWTGFHEGFILSDFSKAFIDCGLGVHMLGPVMMVFGAVATIGSLAMGPMVKQRGQTAVIVSGGVSCALLIAMMFAWTSHPHQAALLFVGAGLGGWTNAVCQSQVRALYGSTFPDQPVKASTTLVFLQSFGLFLNYILQPEVCNFTKTVLLDTSLILAMLGCGGLYVWKRYQLLP